MTSLKYSQICDKGTLRKLSLRKSCPVITILITSPKIPKDENNLSISLFVGELCMSEEHYFIVLGGTTDMKNTLFK
jgi:hypothetical protein